MKQHESWNKRNPQGGHDIALVRLPELARTILDDSEVGVGQKFHEFIGSVGKLIFQDL